MRATVTLPLIGMAAVTLGALAVEFLRRRPIPIQLLQPPRIPLPVRKALPERLREQGL